MPCQQSPTPDSGPPAQNGQKGRTTRFEGSPYWQSNVRIAMGAGLGAALLLCAVCIIVVYMNHSLSTVMRVSGVLLLIVMSFLLAFPGEAIANFPYAVEVEEGKGIRLYAAFKQVYIPMRDIRDVRKSHYWQGYVVRLRRRHRLLSSFVIHWFFGKQAEPLATAIEQEIRRTPTEDSGAAHA